MDEREYTIAREVFALSGKRTAISESEKPRGDTSFEVGRCVNGGVPSSKFDLSETEWGPRAGCKSIYPSGDWALFG